MGFIKDIVSTATGGLFDYAAKKAESDLNQRSAREAAEKNRDIGIEMFNLQKQSNLEQWEREKAYNLDLWERQNKYNTPAAQMERLKEAGLNPRLMFDNGNVGNATAPSVAQLETPELSSPSMDTTRTDFGPRHTAMDYMAIKNNMALIRKTLADTRLVNANAKAVERENKNLESTGGSIRDPGLIQFMMRHGSKIGRGFRDMLKYKGGKPQEVPMFYDLRNKINDFSNEIFIPFLNNKTYK